RRVRAVWVFLLCFFPCWSDANSCHTDYPPTGCVYQPDHRAYAMVYSYAGFVDGRRVRKYSRNLPRYRFVFVAASLTDLPAAVAAIDFSDANRVKFAETVLRVLP